MGQKDAAEKLLEDYPDVFADIVNVLLFHGEEMVKAEDLRETGLQSQYKANDGNLHEQERDVAKYWTRGNVKIALYGLENQTMEDRDMPLRIMNYDGASCRSQLLKGSKERYPVISLVLYYGPEEWKAPLTLHEALDTPDWLKPYVSDYRMNLVNVACLSEEEVGMFQSDFRIVADFFTKMKDPDFVPGKKEIGHVDALMKFFDVFTHDGRFYETAAAMKKEGKEVSQMCDVLDRIEARGITKGRQEGRLEGGNTMVYVMVQDGDTSPERGAKRLGITVEELKKRMSASGYKFPE